MAMRTATLLWAIVATAALVIQGLRFIPESSPVERGALNARADGCIDCHGRPDASFPDDANLSCEGQQAGRSHPRYNGECRDALAYFEVVRLKRSFESRLNDANPNSLLEGERLARQYNCFQCHGELGQGGFQNAGALKGYVPGYFGKDFALLTRNADADSVASWIRHGVDPALFDRPIEGPIARYFIDRQAVSMPIFDSLPEETIQRLADYVIALNHRGAMDAKAIRAYSRETQGQSVIK